METDGKRTRIEMRKVDPDRSPDAKKDKGLALSMKPKIIRIMTGLRNLLRV